VLSALILTGIRLTLLLIAALRRAPVPVLPWLSLPLNILTNIANSLSPDALVYAGLTGDPFFPSARRTRALVAAASAMTRGRNAKDPVLRLLGFAPLTLSFPFALSTYLFVAHTLSSPDSALPASLLAAVVTVLVGRFCVSLVEDTADALYICYCIDKDVGEVHRHEVFEAFENYSAAGRPAPARRHPSPPAVPSPESPIFDAGRDASFDERRPLPSVPTSHRAAMNESASLHLHTVAEESDDESVANESQLFPGSDLF